MARKDVQLARVEPLINLLLVNIHLFCCCHLFSWSVIVVVEVEVASRASTCLDALGAHKLYRGNIRGSKVLESAD
jgi:hypothetical protein